MVLRAGVVHTPHDRLEPGWVAIAGDRITGVGSGPAPRSDRVVDLPEHLIAPGFVDLHVHGGGGASANLGGAEPPDEQIARIGTHHAAHGTTALLPTVVSDHETPTRGALAAIAAAMGGGGPARVLGAHLEGPWIAPSRAGAHDPDAIRPIDRAECDRILDHAAGCVRLVTLAPELPDAEWLVERLARSGIVGSLGHTEADHGVAARAFDRGVRHVTHLFNAMPGIAHRAPGPVVAALADPRVSVEIVADGHHVDPAIIALVFACAHRPLLVTDAIPATGLPPGRHRLGSVEVRAGAGRATLATDPDTLAGSLLTMDRAVALVRERAGIALPVVLAAASAAPADALGRSDLGRLAPGALADLVLLTPDLRTEATVVGGRAVHDPRGLLTGDEEEAT